MKFRIPILFSLVLALLFVCNFADAAKRFDTDVGDKAFVKITKFDNDTYNPTFSPAAFDPAPALVRHKFLPDIYREPKQAHNLKIWNARIDHNYPFQIPSKAGPPIVYSRRE